MGASKQRSAIKADRNHRLAMDLVQAESQSEVVDILEKAGVWHDASRWRLYGDMENNYSTVGNQQDSADQALVEKLMNSSDAILLKECYRAGLDPKSKEAPQTIKDALTMFMGYPHGRLAELPSNKRSELAANSIGLVATGQKGKNSKPNYAIYDFGIGQSPEQFPETFLSLNANNKSEIPFVQGKYNMGSTGVLNFLEDEKLQLILSRRDPALPLEDGCSQNWGVTVVRKLPLKGNMKYPTFAYLTDVNGEVLQFSADALPILPDGKGATYSNDMEYGAFVKLYEYEIGAGLKSALTFDLYNRLSLLLPEMPIPVRIYEERDYKGHTMQATLAGLDTRIEDDRNENLERGFPGSGSFQLDGSTINVKLLAFKKDVDAESGKKVNRKEKYATKEGVVLSLNGQAHGFLDKAFFKRKAVDLGYIADSLLLIVDCSSLTRSQQLEIFMPSRDRMRNGELRRSLELALENLCKNHQGLKDLQAKRRSEMVRRSLEDDTVMADTIEKLVSDSPALSALFLTGTRLADAIARPDMQQGGSFNGKYSPTIFHPVKAYSDDQRRECEQGREHRFEFNTDAENDYFDRAEHRGQLRVSCDGDELQIKMLSLWDGKLYVQIIPPKSIAIGEKFDLTFELVDDTLIEALSVKVPCMATVRRLKAKPKTKRKRNKNANSEGAENRQKGGLALPSITPVSREAWAEYGFDRESAMAVVNAGESWDYFYNKDNIHLQHEQKRLSSDEMRMAEKQYSTALVLIALTLIQNTQQDNENDSAGHLDVEKYVKETTRALSPIILPVIRGLGRPSA